MANLWGKRREEVKNPPNCVWIDQEADCEEDVCLRAAVRLQRNVTGTSSKRRHRLIARSQFSTQSIKGTIFSARFPWRNPASISPLVVLSPRPQAVPAALQPLIGRLAAEMQAVAAPGPAATRVAWEVGRATGGGDPRGVAERKAEPCREAGRLSLGRRSRRSRT